MDLLDHATTERRELSRTAAMLRENTSIRREKNASTLARELIAESLGKGKKQPLSDGQIMRMDARLHANKSILQRWSPGFMAVMQSLAQLHESKAHFAIALLSTLDDRPKVIEHPQLLYTLVRELRHAHYHHNFQAAGCLELEPRGLADMVESPASALSEATLAWVIFAKQGWFMSYWRRVTEDDRFDLIDELTTHGVNWQQLSRAIPIVHQVFSEQAISYLHDLGCDLNAVPGGLHVFHEMATRDDRAAPLVEKLIKLGADTDPSCTALMLDEVISANAPTSDWMRRIIQTHEASLQTRLHQPFKPSNRAEVESANRLPLSDLVKASAAHELVKIGGQTNLFRPTGKDQPFVSAEGMKYVSWLMADRPSV